MRLKNVLTEFPELEESYTFRGKNNFLYAERVDYQKLGKPDRNQNSVHCGCISLDGLIKKEFGWEFERKNKKKLKVREKNFIIERKVIGENEKGGLIEDFKLKIIPIPDDATVDCGLVDLYNVHVLNKNGKIEYNTRKETTNVFVNIKTGKVVREYKDVIEVCKERLNSYLSSKEDWDNMLDIIEKLDKAKFQEARREIQKDKRTEEEIKENIINCFGNEFIVGESCKDLKQLKIKNCSKVLDLSYSLSSKVEIYDSDCEIIIGENVGDVYLENCIISKIVSNNKWGINKVECSKCIFKKAPENIKINELYLHDNNKEKDKKGEYIKQKIEINKIENISITGDYVELTAKEIKGSIDLDNSCIKVDKLIFDDDRHKLSIRYGNKNKVKELEVINTKEERYRTLRPELNINNITIDKIVLNGAENPTIWCDEDYLKDITIKEIVINQPEKRINDNKVIDIHVMSSRSNEEKNFLVRDRIHIPEGWEANIRFY